MTAAIILLCLLAFGAGAAAYVFVPRWLDTNPDGYVTPEDITATTERIYQLTHPLEDEIATQEIRIEPEPEPELAWYELPVDPDEATPHLPGDLPVLPIDPSFTRQWNKAELDEKIRRAEEQAAEAGLVTR